MLKNMLQTKISRANLLSHDTLWRNLPPKSCHCMCGVTRDATLASQDGTKHVETWQTKSRHQL